MTVNSTSSCVTALPAKGNLRPPLPNLLGICLAKQGGELESREQTENVQKMGDVDELSVSKTTFPVKQLSLVLEIVCWQVISRPKKLRSIVSDGKT